MTGAMTWPPGPGPLYPYVDPAAVREVPDRPIFAVPIEVAPDDRVWVLIPRVWAIARRWNDGAPIHDPLGLYAGMEALDRLGNASLQVDAVTLPAAMRVLGAGEGV